MFSDSKTILGIDVGTKRVGVSRAEKDIKIATPLKTFKREGGVAESEILRLIESNNISEVIVGLPLSEQGQETQQCEDVRKFATRLGKRAKIEIYFVDEYGSSKHARGAISDQAIRREARKKDKGKIDAVAAAEILQRWLDQIK